MADKSLRFLLFGEDRGAGKTLGKTADEGVSAASRIGGAFSKLGGAIGGEFGEVLDKIGAGIDQMGEAPKKLGAKLMAGGAMVAGLGAALQVVGSADHAATAQLKAAVEASGQSFSTYKDDVEKMIKTQENYGHSASDTQLALARLTEATGDPKKALESMGVVANLAAAKHEDLAAAAAAVGKVYGGSTKVLKEFGITVDSVKAATAGLATATRGHQSAVANLEHAQRTLADIEAVDSTRKKLTIGQEIQLRNAREAVRTATDNLAVKTDALKAAQDRSAKANGAAKDGLDQLNQKLGGQATAAVSSFSGRLDVMRTKLGDLASTVGQHVGPALTAIGPVIMGVGAIMESGLIPKIGEAIASLMGWVTAQGAAAAASIAAFGAMIVEGLAWGASMLAAGAMAILPFLPIIAVVALVGLAAYELYKHWHTVWGFIKAVGLDAWHFIDNDVVHPLVAGFDWVRDKIGDAVHWIGSHWQLMLAILTGPIGLAVLFIKDHWGQVTHIFDDVVHGIGRVVSNVTGFITAPFRMAFDAVANLWNETIGSLNIKVPGWVPGLGGKGFSFPKLPILDSGGIVTGPTLALLSANSVPEAVVPLPGGRSRGGFGGGDIHVHVPIAMGFIGTPQQLGAAIAQALQRAQGGGFALGVHS